MDKSKKQLLMLKKLADAGGNDASLLLFDKITEIEDLIENLGDTSTPSVKLSYPKLEKATAEMSDVFKVKIDELVKTIKTEMSGRRDSVINDAINGLIDRFSKKLQVDTNVDLSPLLTAFQELSDTIQNTEDIDYTAILKEISDKMDSTDLLSIKENLNNLSNRVEDLINSDNRVRVEVDRIGGGGVISFPIVDALNKMNYLSGSSANGTRALTVADTWYAVPSTVPATPYMLIVAIENAVGTIRWGFDNTGTPSVTNGNQAPAQLAIKLEANHVVYFASSTAGDDVNWTTKTL